MKNNYKSCYYFAFLLINDGNAVCVTGDGCCVVMMVVMVNCGDGCVMMVMIVMVMVVVMVHVVVMVVVW